MSKLTIDNSLGDKPNSASAGKAAGHNTDAFDVSTHDLVIEDSVIHNQDDCLALNKGTNITFQRNSCTGGHGISIGSISTGAVVQAVRILNNTIVNKYDCPADNHKSVTDNHSSDQALRIKTKADATSASVSDVTYSGNTATGTKKYGIIIDQSYPETLGTPGTGCSISVRRRINVRVRRY
jgi:polygalacturonase